VSTLSCTVNGEDTELAPDTTVAGLVERWCPSPRGVAVAVNGEVVPKSTWDDTTVAAGDTVEIVSAAAGG
jgi:sulfur carrier protein